MARISLLENGIMMYEDVNSIFSIRAFDAGVTTCDYTDEETAKAEGDSRKLIYQDAVAKEIGSMQPEISRKTAEYVIIDWKIKDDAMDSLIIPNYIESDDGFEKKIISAIHPKARTYYYYEGSKNVQRITVKENIRFLPAYFFMNFENLKSISLPSTIESIGYNCFLGLKKLEDIELPDQIQIINAGTFGLCYNLETVQLPQSLKAIARGAFFRTGLKAVVIPDQTEIIAQRAFAECKSLKQVILPESLYYIADDAFEGCPDDICFLVPRFSYAERWAEERWFSYRFID